MDREGGSGGWTDHDSNAAVVGADAHKGIFKALPICGFFYPPVSAVWGGKCVYARARARTPIRRDGFSLGTWRC